MLLINILNHINTATIELSPAPSFARVGREIPSRFNTTSLVKKNLPNNVSAPTTSLRIGTAKAENLKAPRLAV